jgi:hypothetical protein
MTELVAIDNELGLDVQRQYEFPPFKLRLRWHNKLEGANWEINKMDERRHGPGGPGWYWCYSHTDYWWTRFAYEIMKEELPRKAAAIALGVGEISMISDDLRSREAIDREIKDRFDELMQKRRTIWSGRT